ncbi:MAG: hypothetical protein M3Q45_02855 [Chloroflexota bacterium]|nr:hypothetical protein [Chloroflexota bacterium]
MTQRKANPPAPARADDSMTEPTPVTTNDRAPGESEQRFDTLAWLLEGANGLLGELRHNRLGLSEEFWAHARAARQESLLALRAALDAWIAHSESQEPQSTDQQKRRKRRGGIPVDF